MLEIENLSVFYNDLQAIFDVSFSVATGETMALIGANGAGKTTLLKAITGMIGVKATTFSFAGRPVLKADAVDRAISGIAMAPEGRRVFSGLTVRENLQMGANVERKRYWTVETVEALFPALREHAHRPAGLLSGGQQQMIAIGRALMANPRLLLLDEVSLGLAPVIVDEVYAGLKKVKSEDMSIILVEQDINRALAASDRFVCLLEGSIKLSGSTKGADRAAISRAYFGEA